VAVCYLYWPKSETPAGKPGVFSVVSKKKYVQLLFVGDLMFDRGARYYAAKNGSNEFIFDKISICVHL
jgi:hypothetical protein